MAVRAHKNSHGTAKAVSRETVLVTGAGGLVGSRLVERLLQAGQAVDAVYHSKASRDAALRRHAEAVAAGRLRHHVIDLLRPQAAVKVCAALKKAGSAAVGLVHCARSRANLVVDGAASEKQWASEYQLGVTFAFDLVSLLGAAPDTRLRRVVLVGSMYGMVSVNPNLYPAGVSRSPVHYGAAKAAMLLVVRELAVRFAPQGITVNAISIGGIEGRTSAAFKKRYAELCPQGRMLSVDDVVKPIEFLLSDAAGAIVGHNLVVDGGWSIW